MNRNKADFSLCGVFVFYFYFSSSGFICQLLRVEKYEKEYVRKGILSLLTEGRDEMAS